MTPRARADDRWMDDRWMIGAFQSTASLPAPDQTCPAAGAIWSAVHGQVSAAETHAIVDHLASCGACTDAWRIAREAGSEEAGGEAEAAPALNPGHRTWRTWGALAAAAVVVVSIGILGFMTRRSSEPDGSIVREAAPSGVSSLVPDGGSLPRHACRLRWTPAPGSRYAVRVAAEDLTPIAIGRGLSEPEYVVPEASLADVRSGAKILWQVDALLPDGTRQTSPTFVVTIVDGR